jgi:glutamate dehydrogenase/leucine dehydrogenase
MPVRVYLDEDADLLDLQNKVCAVIGFGSQGNAHALNLTDSGIEVIVGLYQGSKSIPIAQQYGFRVLDVAEAAQKTDVIFSRRRISGSRKFMRNRCYRIWAKQRPYCSVMASRSTSEPLFRRKR